MACLLNPSSSYSKPDPTLLPLISFVTSRKFLNHYFYYLETFSKCCAYPFFSGEGVCILGIQYNPSLLFPGLPFRASYSNIIVIESIC